ncbi:adenine phosphoribosyltransferase [bacterium]|nr:adenine phosphoribosyltransferase [bacterium]NIO73582.1 adenine phosphoribosyltransferase [bacterium]
MKELQELIRSIPDFPKKGILFRDITTLLQNGSEFRRAIDILADHYKGKKIDQIVAVESRGFIIASPLAYKLNAGIIPVRKKGKLPYKTVETTYELEYGTDTLEMHADAFHPGANILIVDDLLATGGTAKATIDLVEKLKGKVVGICFLIELTDLKGVEKLKGYEVLSIIKY